MRKFTRIVAVALTLCMGGVALTACSDKKTDENAIESAVDNTNENKTESKTEEVSENLNKEENERTTEATSKITTYAPTDEIKKASFESGLIQIGNDIFHQYGYYTVNQFIEKYKDRYDVYKDDFPETAFDPNEIYDKNYYNNYGRLIKLKSKNDSEIYLYAEFDPLENNESTPVGDCVVMKISSPAKKYVWYPQYQENLNLTDTDSFLDSLGYKKTDKNPADELKYDYYWHLEKTSYSEEYYLLYVKSNEENLFGEYPIFIYKTVPDKKTGKVALYFDDSYSVSKDWKSAKEGE